MIIMIQPARFTRQKPSHFSPISSGEQSKRSQGISRNNTAIAKADIGAIVRGDLEPGNLVFGYQQTKLTK
jgi:hypothetical protein